MNVLCVLTHINITEMDTDFYLRSRCIKLCFKLKAEEIIMENKISVIFFIKRTAHSRLKDKERIKTNDNNQFQLQQSTIYEIV